MTDSNCIIFDIDGTLADVRHRVHHVQGRKKNWTSFFDAMGDDPVIDPVAVLARTVSAGDLPVICVSGRPSDYRDVTERWLSDAGVPFVELYMRAAGDHRPDDTVKLQILNGLRSDGWEPLLVIDDRQRVVDMWREQGLICLQAQPDVGWPQRLPETAPSDLLYLMIGPTCGGKSTYAEAHFDPRWIISSDEIRETVYGDRHDQTHNQAVFEAVHDVAKARLRRGMPTVIDATHLRRKDRMNAAKLTPEGHGCRYIICNRPLETKKADADWRPDWLIEKHDQTFRSQAKDILAGDGLDFVTVTDTRDNAKVA